MKNKRLNLVRSLILFHVKKDLRLAGHEYSKNLAPLINLLIFVVILLAFKKLENQKLKKSDELLSKPNIF